MKESDENDLIILCYEMVKQASSYLQNNEHYVFGYSGILYIIDYMKTADCIKTPYFILKCRCKEYDDEMFVYPWTLKEILTERHHKNESK